MEGCCPCWLLSIGLLSLIAVIAKKLYLLLFATPKVPFVPENNWWGAEETKVVEEDTSITPFNIHIAEKELDELHKRLSEARPFTQSLPGTQHQYGLNSHLLKEIIEFWRTKYDWRKRETFLNKYPQYTTKINGLNIHFLHVKPPKSTGQKVLPLLLLHGWPGSVREFYETIPLLTQPNPNKHFAFELVVPHLPGFGFSEASSRTGLNTTQMAAIAKSLMVRLGFEKWYVQGGDWGSEIGTHMAILYSRNVLGLHINMAVVQTPMFWVKRVLGCFWPGLIVDEKYKKKMFPLMKGVKDTLRESGYFHLQATKPDTIGFALNDSPIGLAAYLLEKFIAWTKRDLLNEANGGLAAIFGYEKLLDIITIYWFTKSITTSMRIYAEACDSTNPFKALVRIPVDVPTAYAYFDNDASYISETLLKTKFKNLLQYSTLPKGGHFAAFEEPELFAEDVWSAVEKFEEFYKRM